MPVYDFQCPCGVRFEKLVRDNKTESLPCPSCKEIAPKILSSFGFIFGSGKECGNTGVDSLDTGIDKAVGRDADTRWEFIKDRESMKHRAIREHGSVHLKRTEEGYEPMKKEEAGRSISKNKEYQTLLKEHKEKREAEGIPQIEE